MKQQTSEQTKSKQTNKQTNKQKIPTLGTEDRRYPTSVENAMQIYSPRKTPSFSVMNAKLQLGISF